MRLSEAARKKVEKEKATKAMQRARAKTIPKSPDTLDELIVQLQDPSTPEVYRDMYLGNVQRNIKGISISLTLTCGLPDD